MKKVDASMQDLPLTIRPLSENEKKAAGHLIGMKVGRLTCLGLSADTPKRWVVRCVCGNYLLRSAKALNNPNNAHDACDHCRHLIEIKRSEIWRRTGKNTHFADMA